MQITVDSGLASIQLHFDAHRAKQLNTDLTKEQKDYAIFFAALSGFLCYVCR